MSTPHAGPTPMPDPDRAAAESPHTPAVDLARIAQSRPDLHHLLASNPATYPDLVEWLAQSSDPQVRAIVAHRRLNPSAAPQGREMQPVQTPQPQIQALGSEPSTPTSKPTRWTKGRLVGAIGAGSVAIFVAVFLAVFFLLEVTAPSYYTVGPTRMNNAGTEFLGNKPRLQPMGDGTSLITSGDMTIMRLADGEMDLLVGMSATHREHQPSWIQPYPIEDGEPASCWIHGSSLECGSKAFNLLEGYATPAAHFLEPPENAIDIAATTGNDAILLSGVDDALRDTASTAWAPYRTNGENLLTVDGETVSDVTLPVATETSSASAGTWITPAVVGTRIGNRVLPGAKTLWILGCNTGLVALDGNEVVWRLDMSETERVLNGIDAGQEPLWVVENDAIVLATADGIRALEPLTGDELWRVNAEVTSWAIAGSAMVVTTPESVAFFDMPIDEAMAGSADFPDSAGEEVRDPSEPFEVSTPLPTYVLTMDDVANKKIQVPQSCGWFGLDYFGDKREYYEATFVNGVVNGNAQGSFIRMINAWTTWFGNNSVLLVEFKCTAGGAYDYTSFGLYNSNLDLIGRVEPWGENAFPALQGSRNDSPITDVSFVGYTLKFNAPNIQIYGDGSAHVSPGSTTAEVTMECDRFDLHIQDIVYHTPTGDVRMPEIENIRSVFATVVRKEESEDTLRHLSPEVIDLLGRPEVSYGGSTWLPRDLAFPLNATVVDCAMAGSVDDFGKPWNSMFVPIEGKVQEVSVSRASSVIPGDLVCPVIREDETDKDKREGPGKSYLVVRADENGDFVIKATENSYTDL